MGALDAPALLRYDPDDFYVSNRTIRLPQGLRSCSSYDVDEGRSEIVITTEFEVMHRLSYAVSSKMSDTTRVYT